MKPFWELGLNSITMKKEPHFDYVEFKERSNKAKKIRYEKKND